MAKLIPHNFTTYSLSWMPEKIETVSTTQTSWSSSTVWSDPPILELTFECDATMLLLIFTHCIFVGIGSLRLLLDDTVIPETQMVVNSCMWSPHSVAIKTKGIHTLKMQMISNEQGVTVYGYGRRMSILKGFYQGGTT